MYHHVFTEREKSRRNKTIIEKKATIIVKKKRQHAITSLSHRCHGFQVLVLPSPQDRAPAPIHALHSPYHLACIRLVPYDYPTHAATTTKYRAEAEQESSICRSPATPGHCQDHVHTRHEVQSRAHSAHLVDRKPQEYARDDHAARDLEVCTVLTPDSTTASMPRTEKTIDSTPALTMGHERRGPDSQRVTRGRHMVLASVNRLALPDRQRFFVKTGDESCPPCFDVPCRRLIKTNRSRFTEIAPQISAFHPHQSTSATAPRKARHFPRSSG